MTWLRRNRYWLLALPLVLALTVAASAYNVKRFWYDAELRHAIATAEPGEFVTATDEYTDPFGDTSRTLRVRFVEVDESPTYPSGDGEAPPPAGVKAVVVRLEFEADPAETLNICQVTVEDTEGRQYIVPDSFGQSTPCLPDDRTGPQLPATRDTRRGYVVPGEERPPTWQAGPVFLMPEDAEVSRVLIWWDRPDYVELPAR